MSNIYTDHTYLKNNPTWNAEDAQFKAEEIIRLLERNPVDFRNVGEIGCGSGEILVQLAARFDEAVKFTGFDISKDAIDIAGRKAGSRLKFEHKDIVGSGEKYFFDLLLVIDVIEHIEDYFGFLDKISPMGRYTIFHIPLDMNVWSLFREKMLIESKNRVGHIHNFTEDFIMHVLADKGFRIMDKAYTEPSFEHMSFKQRMVNSVRKALFKVNKRFCTKTLGGYSLLVLAENKIASH